MEKVIQTKNCKKCNAVFEITDKDLEFYKKVSPKFNWKVYKIPSPTLCPDCRQQRRLAFRNERKLYKRKCDATGKEIISIYSPDKQFKVYNQDYWWSDKWDAMDYWRDFDFNKSFFGQFGELLKEVPKIALNWHITNENSEYVNFFVNSKNCYYCFGWWYNENVLYSTQVANLKYSCDNLMCNKWENYYNCVSCSNSYNIFNSLNLIWCTNVYNSYHCKGCIDCLFCVWLNNKQYYILNKKYSKKDFLYKKEIILKENINYQKKINKLIINYNNNIIINSEDCTWNYIFNSNKVKQSFDVFDTDKWKFLHNVVNFSEIYDSYWVWYWELCYDIQSSSMNIYKIVMWINIREWSNNIFYSQDISSSSNLFWCVWLKNKQYCILNKQYTKEEYENLVPKIIEHMSKPHPNSLVSSSCPHPNPLPKGEGIKGNIEWWEFFPAYLSPFWYNETVAQEYFPLTKEEAKGYPQGEPLQNNNVGCTLYGCPDNNYIFNWSDYKAPFSKVEKIIPANKLPSNIKDIPDDILNRAIECEESKKPFRIIKQELEFYRKHNLPIPRKHPDIRHKERMKLRNPRKLYDKKCDKCWKDIKSTYVPDRKEIVYCEECYNKEVY